VKNYARYWGGALVALPLFLRPAALVDVRTMQNQFFCFLCVFALAVFGLGRQRDGLIVSACAGVIAMGFFNQFNYMAPYVVVQWACTALGLLAFVQMCSFFKAEDTRTVAVALGVVCLTQALWVLVRTHAGDPHLWALSLFRETRVVPVFDNPASSGSLGNPSYSSALIGISLPALAYLNWWLLMPLCFVALYLCSSATAWASAVAGLVAYYVLCRHPRQLPLLALALAASLGAVFLYGQFFGGFFSDSERVASWIKLWDALDAQTLLIGKGPGWLDHHPITRPGFRFHPAHNVALDILVSYGALGLVSALLVVWRCLKGAYAPFPAACLCAFGVSGLAFFPLHISATALVGMVCLALCFVSKGESYGRIYH
jgi:hypothetical protein